MSNFFRKKLKVIPVKIFVVFLFLSFSTLLFLTSEIKSQAEEATSSASEASDSAKAATTEASPSAQIADQATESVQKPSETPWKDVQGTYIAPGEKVISGNIDPSGKFFADELIVQFKDTVSDEEKAVILAEKGLVTKMVSYYSKAHLVRVDFNQREKILGELSSDPRVQRADRSTVFKATSIPRVEPNDPYFVDGHQYGLEKIKAPEAWSVTKGSSGKYIAVIDTGVDYNHPDLQNKVIIGRNFTEAGGQCDPMDNDVSSHGTRDAGVAAAVTNNGIGVAGTAWSPKIVAIKVADQAHPGAGMLALAEGISYAVNPYPPPFGCPDVPKADVINISFAGSEDNPWVKDAINTALSNNVLVVAGVANNRDAGECFMGYPAAYPGVISVGGTNLHDAFSSGCYQPGPETTDNGYTLTAPEYEIYGPVEGGGYGGDSGTSLAGPFVSGALATYLSINPDPNTARNALINSVDDLGNWGYDSTYGYGRLNFCKLVGGTSCSPSVSLYVSKDIAKPYQHVENVNVGEDFYITVRAQAKQGISRLALWENYNQKWYHTDCYDNALCQMTWPLSFDQGAFGKNVWIVGAALATDESQGFTAWWPYKPYTIYVSGGGTPTPETQSGKSPPPYLKDLTTSSGSVKINLNWTDTAGESGFALQKSIAGGTFSDFKELSANTTSYSDTLPSSQEGKKLTYRVRAGFQDNSYSLSNEESIDAPTSYTPPGEWPGTVEVTTSCTDNDIQAHLTFAPIQESAWYHIYDSYKGSSEQYVVKLRAQDYPPDRNINYDWEPRENLGGIEVLNAGEYYVRVVAEGPTGNVDSGQIKVPATNCSPTPPPMDPPGTGTLTVTISCDSLGHAWAHADWNVRGGYTGKYLFQYKLSSQSTWTNSATGAKFGTWDDVGLLTFKNGDHNFRVITTQDNQVWVGPITVNVYCKQPSGELKVAYRCLENGTPVADLSWNPYPDPYNELDRYEVTYKRPGGDWVNWLWAADPPDTSMSTDQEIWYGEPLISGEIWGWKVGAHLWGYSTIDWGGPVYAQIPYCPVPEPPPPCPCDSFGDLNNDGAMTQSDIDMISKSIAGEIVLTDEQKRRADVNEDGNISQADIDIVKNYIVTAISTFPVCEDTDNDGLPNYRDTDDDGDGVIDPPMVSITVSPATVTAGEPFMITVTGTSPVGLAFVWWFGQNTGITDATVTITYPPEPTSLFRACTDVVNPTKLDRAFCSPLFGAQQAVTIYSFTSSVIINQPGTYRFGANTRDVLYPTPGEAHQASEGAGIQVVEVQNQPPSLAAIGSQTVTEGQPLKMTVSATDPDNDPLTYNATNLPQGASFSGQTFSWTPSYQQNGTHEVTFTASDGRLTDSKTTTITVLNDEDRDGFADTVELYIGTDPQDACPDRKENYNPAYPGDDAWPFDINNDTKVNVLDINRFRTAGVLNTREGNRKYKRRYDLNADGKVDVLDINLYSARGVLNTRCSN